MGNILTLMHGRTAMEHCHAEQICQERTTDNRFQCCRPLILRAISEHIRCKLNLNDGPADCQFQLWSILLCTAISELAHREPTYEKGVANNQFQLYVVLIVVLVPYYVHREQINKKGIAHDPFQSLPEDIQCTILSKLSLIEVVRTSALSRKWKCSWTVCPKLRFDGITMCGKSMRGKHQYIKKFISNTNAALAQCRGTVVEELAVKIDFHSMLVEHLNNWISFAVSSWTKSLAFDLTPENFRGRVDRYRFPFELLDIGCMSRLQQIQLSFGYIQPPMKFSGFPKLKKLDLHLVLVSGKDLEIFLSKCRNLEWLSIVRCHLKDELKVNGSLPHLLYLNVACCEITSISLHAAKLKSFVYDGWPVPIDLNKSSKLDIADMYFYRVALEHVFTEQANVLINVENLTLNTYCKSPELPYLIDHRCKFSHLKFLKLMLFFREDVDTLSLVSFLRSAPFIEKLEMHFSIFAPLYVGDGLMRFTQRQYNYLKDLCITGFEGSNGQLEFLLYMVENAPALEILTIDRLDIIVKQRRWKDGDNEGDQAASVHRAAIRCIEEKISPMCCVRLL